MLMEVGCVQCGIVFGAPRDYILDRARFGGRICCPNGHRLKWDPPADPSEESEFATAQRAMAVKDRRIARLEERLAAVDGLENAAHNEDL